METRGTAKDEVCLLAMPGLATRISRPSGNPSLVVTPLLLLLLLYLRNN
jgi:hypothetical protein